MNKATTLVTAVIVALVVAIIAFAVEEWILVGGAALIAAGGWGTATAVFLQSREETTKEVAVNEEDS